MSCRTGPEALDRWVEIWTGYVQKIHGLASALFSARWTDEAAAAALDERMTFMRGGCGLVVAWLDREGALSPDVDTETATDLMWALASPQVWGLLAEDRQWSPDRYRDEITRVMKRVLLKA